MRLMIRAFGVDKFIFLFYFQLTRRTRTVCCIDLERPENMEAMINHWPLQMNIAQNCFFCYASERENKKQDARIRMDQTTSTETNNIIIIISPPHSTMRCIINSSALCLLTSFLRLLHAFIGHFSFIPFANFFHLA